MEPLAAQPLRCSGPRAKVLAVLLCLALCAGTLLLLQLRARPARPGGFYGFEVKDAAGRPVSLEKFKGKALHREFGPFHFSVLAFPCNQFGEAEPRPSREVVSFARSTYGVTFPIFHKIKILGPEAEPAFRFLVDSSNKEPRWNFWKYLVSPEGRVVRSWRPEESVDAIRPEVADLIRQMIIRKREDL
ncbi:probable glutathione peroxidase 8 isoform X2 [Myotis myotis]|uniref:probable glutathione peroxidase 8 isoform X2 n=1 Tax=Myotis myotis TaxID=51298 RepID=UPI0017492572|nr:probable glutathione peroxidase 8 isoform X2 [Myotis myotis]